MKLSITETAYNWLKNNLDLLEGDEVRLFVRYGGYSTINPGFSLGIMKEISSDVGASVKINGITFFVKYDDIWYFSNHDLEIKIDEVSEEIKFELFKEEIV